MQAMPQAQEWRSALPAQHSAISSLFWLTTQKKHYTTPNTVVFTVSSCTRHKANVMAMFAKKQSKSGFGCAGTSIDSGGGPWGWAVIATHGHPQIPIPASCPRVSGSPLTGTDSVRTRLVSLIHNSQFRCTKQNGTKPPAKSRSSSRRCRYKSPCFLRCVVGSVSAVIGSHGYGGYGWQC